MGPEPGVLIALLSILAGMYAAMGLIILLGTRHQRKGTTMDRIIDGLYALAESIREAARRAIARARAVLREARAAYLRRQAAKATAERAEHGDPGVDELNVAAALASVDLDVVAENPGQPLRDWNATP